MEFLDMNALKNKLNYEDFECNYSKSKFYLALYLYI